MNRFATLLLVLALALGGCSGAAVTGPADRNDTDAAETERMIGIYAAIIRQLVTKDHTFGDGPSPFDRVFVVDGVSDDGARGAVPVGTEPFSPEVKAGILRELADLPPVRFVSDPDFVVIEKHGCAQVKGNGALITLGAISGGKEKVTVPSDLFFACLAEQHQAEGIE